MDAEARARASARHMLERDACSRNLGISIDVRAAGSVVAAMEVTDELVNGFGVCHGGIVFTLADTAFAFACNGYNDETLSVSANVEWLKPVHAGNALTATASEDNRSGRHGYYTVHVHNQDGELVAIFHGHSVSRGEPLFTEDADA